MHAFATDVLGSKGRFAVDSPVRHWRAVALLTIVAAGVYGAVCGSHAGRPLQVAYSGMKLPFLLGGTFALCLPSFYVLNATLGLRDDFGRVLRGVGCAQATLGLALASLAPVTGFVYVSGVSYAGATLVNLAMFSAATLAGQWTLARHYAPLLERDRRHGIALVCWTVLYGFVGLQLAWNLRPFIGSESLETTFFREGGWTNGYVEAFRAMRIEIGR